MGWFLKLILPKWVAGICLAPFGIYLVERYIDNERIINHERIHWFQQTEMLIIFFYLWYLIEWIVKLFKYGGQAYTNLSFEREARYGESRENYEIERKSYAWIKFL